jgi:siroheme synthase-like protein
MLRLEDKKCVVIGGGRIAARKISRLLEAGADVTVIAPDFGSDVRTLVDDGALHAEQRGYVDGDLSNAAIAFAATSSPTVNAAVANEACRRNIPVNVADDPTASTFHVPAVVDRDDLTVAVSTSGRSPAFARSLRDEIDELLSSDRLELLELYAQLRDELGGEQRSSNGSAWAAAYSHALELVRAGQPAQARRVLREHLVTGVGREI